MPKIKTKNAFFLWFCIGVIGVNEEIGEAWALGAMVYCELKETTDAIIWFTNAQSIAETETENYELQDIMQQVCESTNILTLMQEMPDIENMTLNPTNNNNDNDNDNENDDDEQSDENETNDIKQILNNLQNIAQNNKNQKNNKNNKNNKDQNKKQNQNKNQNKNQMVPSILTVPESMRSTWHGSLR